ncbi:hypothetical protein K502DRAFT_290251 [Neoconidiobolus thromboides FSU 785]|nr:hypothetical protein K502DRAFT_290251 [Neoconidiobolus thromboides FSU 785]
MSSGFGLNGGISRCFPMWQEVHKCYAVSDDPKSCKLQLDDYFECLHHNKEVLFFYHFYHC